MKRLLEQAVRHYYSTERRSSVQQLRADFGEFPPAPLTCEGPASNFEVVRVRSLGIVISELLMLKRTMLGAQSEDQALSPAFIAQVGAGQVAATRTGMDGLNRAPKIVKFIVLTAVYAFAAIRLSMSAFRYRREHSARRGAFYPVQKNESEIIIRSAPHDRAGSSDEPTISHEHIHLLQHYDLEAHSREARSPEILLNEKGAGEPHLLYILQKREVEARLHESVLSFYRVHRRLPMTVPEFVRMLASSKRLGEFVNIALQSTGERIDQEGERYPEREDFMVEQLEFILISSKTPDLSRRFIVEVLSVMYGNLLRYYGDIAASRKLLDEIERPNLYDELYGAQTRAEDQSLQR